MRRLSKLLFILSSIVLCQCQSRTLTQADTLFKLISPDSSGINFENTIVTSDSINILNYEYLYNGGGVGIADFNNDALPDVFFTGNMVPCKLYLNKGEFKFEDITLSSHIDTRRVWAYGVSVVDINHDGWQDIYVSVGGIGNKDIFPNKLYINQGDLTFKECAQEYGLADRGESIQAIFFDYDRDGDLDMYLLTGGGFEKSAIVPRPILKDGTARNTDRLYRNDFDKQLGHPVFTNVSRQAHILEEGFGLGVSIVDVNNDGWLDVYVSNDYLSNDLLYVNNQDGTFSENASLYFKHTSHFAMGNDVGDINNDGFMDILTVDMLPEDHYRRKLMYGPSQYDRFYFAISQGYSHQYMRNTLQLNNGNGSFSEVGQLAGIYKTDWSWSPLFADFDNDGYQDLFITNGFGKDITDLDFVKFRNEASGLLDKESIRKSFNDSLVIRPGIIKPNYIYKNKGNLTFEKKVNDFGFSVPSLSNGAAYADLDLDGDLDLVVNNINDKAFVYKNMLVEHDSSHRTNFLQVVLHGDKKNPMGIGSTIQIKCGKQDQVRLQNTVRGFESSASGSIHFGLGEVGDIDTLKVTWNDGRINELYSIKANQVINVDHNDSREIVKKPGVVKPKYFEAVSSKVIAYKHHENDFNDFNYEPLLPHKLSQEGPGVAVGDVNGDGLDDAYIGGSYHSPGMFLLQRKNGTFVLRKFFSEDSLSEDMGCLLFDADQDNDLDLYVVSGGREYSREHKRYQDRLYKNDGNGNFVRDESALPKMLESGSCVVAADYDQDGDLDLFVGGRVVPLNYPTSPSSYILRNDRGKFSDVTDVVAPGLKKIGMVTSALWSDVDGDYDLDLLMVGEWMPVTLFKNKHGQFRNETNQAGLKDDKGMWNSLVAGDFDNDGDMDYVAGNLGLNTPLKASVDEPMSIYYGDFDNNGSIDPIIGYFEEGIQYPVASLDDLTKQLPFLKKHILYYRSYANASVENVMSMIKNHEETILSCTNLRTSFIENTGNSKFKVKALLTELQFAPVYGMIAEDINADGKLDLVAIGNSYSTEVVTGRYDAMIGTVLLGDGKNGFKSLKPNVSGFNVSGDAKGMSRIDVGKNSSYVIATQNNDSIKTFQFKEKNIKRVKANQNETFAILTLDDGKRRLVELSYGSTYLSQSSRSVLMSPYIKVVDFFDIKGNLLRSVKTDIAIINRTKSK